MAETPWRLGVVVIASRTEDHGFASRQGCKVLRPFCIAVLLSQLKMHFHCAHLRKNECYKKNGLEKVVAETDLSNRARFQVRLHPRQGGARVLGQVPGATVANRQAPEIVSCRSRGPIFRSFTYIEFAEASFLNGFSRLRGELAPTRQACA
jgi:hypothetical protein